MANPYPVELSVGSVVKEAGSLSFTDPANQPGGSISAVGGDGSSVSPASSLAFAGAITEGDPGVANVGTFTWAQDTNPTSAPTNASPTDGQTWLYTGHAESDGYYTLFVWLDIAGGWTNYIPTTIQNSFGTDFFTTLNDGGFKFGGTTFPTTDPHVAGQLWLDGTSLQVSAG